MKVEIQRVFDANLGVYRVRKIWRQLNRTDDLFQAVSIAAADTFVDRLVASVRDLDDPAEILVECVAFTVEQLHQERYLSLMLDRRPDLSTQQFTSAIPADLTRTLLTRLPIDWRAHGVTARAMDRLVEIYLRTLQSLVADPGPRRSGKEVRAFLRQWLAPAVAGLTLSSEAHPKPSLDE